MEQHRKERLEQDLANALTEGDMVGKEPDATALRRLSPRYEIRTQTERDPIVEETKLVREMAKEIDDRYDKYIARSSNINKEQDEAD